MVGMQVFKLFFCDTRIIVYKMDCLLDKHAAFCASLDPSVCLLVRFAKERVFKVFQCGRVFYRTSFHRATIISGESATNVLIKV